MSVRLTDEQVVAIHEDALLYEPEDTPPDYDGGPESIESIPLPSMGSQIRQDVLMLLADRAAILESERALRDERGALAKGIADAAQKAGIYNDEVPLTGPQLLLLCDDLARQAISERDLLAAAIEVWETVPATYDPEDPMVKRHAMALTALRDAIANAQRQDAAIRLVENDEGGVPAGRLRGL